jgi:hypothetical protein
LMLQAYSLVTRPLTDLNLGNTSLVVAESGILSLLMPLPLAGRAIQEVRRQNAGSQQMLRRVTVGLFIALPLLCVFTILFSSADLIFGGYVQGILDNFRFGNLFGHAVLTLTLGWVISGGLTYALTRRGPWPWVFDDSTQPNGEPLDDASATAARAETGGALDGAASRLRGWLGMVESSIVLFSIDALFAIFVAIQFAALFGGERFLRSQGLTYSDYARRGFFELLAVSLITLALIVTLDFVTTRRSRGEHTLFVVGGGLMIGLTVAILASAYERMQLYEEAYGFTELRVYPHIFMIWLAVLLVYFLVFLALDRQRLFAIGTLVACIGFVATMDVLNPDALIVRQNVARYQQGESLDVAYLGTLSEDAVPYLVPLLYQQGSEIGAQVGPWLRTHLDRLDARQATASWASYNFSINHAYRLLDANRALIEQFEPASPRYGGSD